MRLIIYDLWYMPFIYVINFWLSERGGERPKGGAPHFPPLRESTLLLIWTFMARDKTSHLPSVQL